MGGKGKGSGEEDGREEEGRGEEGGKSVGEEG